MPSWALTCMQSVIKKTKTSVSIYGTMAESPGRSSEDEIFLLLGEGIINAREDTSVQQPCPRVFARFKMAARDDPAGNRLRESPNIEDSLSIG